MYPSSGSVTQNLNRALAEPFGEWAWLQAPDHVFSPDLLSRLLDHNAPVVVPLCVKRSAPYALTIGAEITVTDELSGRDYPGYLPLEIGKLPSLPFPVEIAGTAGMLIRRQVLDTIGFPYFESTDGLYLNEDIEFCRKVRGHGFQIVCDPGALIGHIASTPIWPL